MEALLVVMVKVPNVEVDDVLLRHCTARRKLYLEYSVVLEPTRLFLWIENVCWNVEVRKLYLKILCCNRFGKCKPILAARKTKKGG